MKVLISGSSGLIGSALIGSLEGDGHGVGCLPRTYENPVDFTGVHAVVHLAGENIEIFNPRDFIAAITQHIPDKNFQLVRYYGG